MIRQLSPHLQRLLQQARAESTASFRCCVSHAGGNAGTAAQSAPRSFSSAAFKNPKLKHLTGKELAQQQELRDRVYQACSERNCKRTLAALQHARAAGVAITDVPTVLAAIKSFGSGKQLQHAFRVVEMMQADGREPLVQVYTALISACGRCGDWRRAVEVLESMKQQGPEPNGRTYTAAIDACAKAQQFTNAVALLREAQAAGVQLDVYTYTAAMRACSSQAVARSY
jgi:pentatricopeptide repeat protein